MSIQPIQIQDALNRRIFLRNTSAVGAAALASLGLGNSTALGHCGEALKDHKQSSILLIPGAPHTLLMLPAAQQPQCT